MGLIAGGGHFGQRDSRWLLKFHDQDLHYVPEIKRVIKKQELGFHYHNPPAKEGYLHFNQSELESTILTYEPGFKIHEGQIGLFVNPRHTKIIGQRWPDLPKR